MEKSILQYACILLIFDLLYQMYYVVMIYYSRIRKTFDRILRFMKCGKGGRQSIFFFFYFYFLGPHGVDTDASLPEIITQEYICYIFDIELF